MRNFFFLVHNSLCRLCQFYSGKQSWAAQRKDSCLACPYCGTHQAKEPRKEGEQTKCTFPESNQAISCKICQAAQCSQGAECGVPETKCLQREHEDGLENGEQNRACLPRGANSQKWQDEVASQGTYKGLGNSCNPESHCLAGQRTDRKGSMLYSRQH